MGTESPDATTHEVSTADLVAEVRATFTRLDRWRTVLASRVEPKADSELAADDQIWKWAPPTSLCLASLGAAREHLHAIRLLLDAGELFPAVTSTLARSALMSGAVAVWMLEPEDAQERRRRMLTFALEDYRNHITFGQQATRTFHRDDIRPTAAENLERVRQRAAEVRALLDQFGGPISWNLTDTVIAAAVHRTTRNDRQRAQFKSRWRVMSGAAHGFIWPHFGAAGTSISNLDSSGVGVVTIGGSVETVVIDYFTAYHVTAQGWMLFAQRANWPELAG